MSLFHFGMLLPKFGGAVKAFFVLTFSSRANKGASIDFIAYGGDTYQSTESDVQMFIDKVIFLLKNNVNVPTNSSNDNLEIKETDLI